MLGFWRSHIEYQDFVSLNLTSSPQVDRAALLEYESETSKLFILDLDPLKSLISPLYSHTGRPSNFQPEIFRSLILMQHMGFALNNWVPKLEKNFLLRTICGFLDKMPNFASYYDFINRIIDLDERPRLKRKKRKPSKKIGKGKKLPIVDTFMSDSASDNYPTYQLLDQWNINAVIALNSTNKGNFKYPKHLSVDKHGVPICQGGNKMLHHGFCGKDRCRLKWRCPKAVGKPFENCINCSPSSYGRVIFLLKSLVAARAGNLK